MDLGIRGKSALGTAASKGMGKATAMGLAADGGRVLTIQSVSVKQPVPGLLLSNAVRPGTAGMVKTLSEELGPHNITINVVCPGKILTDRLLGGAKQAGLGREEFLEKAGADIPLRRVGTPEEFANVMVFLASERASYVTGVALQVDGGLIRSNV